jgi:hypothetical protein
MLLEVFEKKLAGHLDHENVVVYSYGLNRFKPGFKVLPLHNVLDDLQAIRPHLFSAFFHVTISSFYIELRIVTVLPNEFSTGCVQNNFFWTGRRISIKENEKKIFIHRKIC